MDIGKNECLYWLSLLLGTQISHQKVRAGALWGDVGGIGCHCCASPIIDCFEMFWGVGWLYNPHHFHGSLYQASDLWFDVFLLFSDQDYSTFDHCTKILCSIACHLQLLRTTVWTDRQLLPGIRSRMAVLSHFVRVPEGETQSPVREDKKGEVRMC